MGACGAPVSSVHMGIQEYSASVWLRRKDKLEQVRTVGRRRGGEVEEIRV